MTESRRYPGTLGVVLASTGAVLVIVTTWVIFAWTPIEATQGVIQRIYYVHVPLAWISEMAFGMTALLGIMYLWLRDDRLDAAAVSAAEGGVFTATGLLIVGPLWARVAWGTYWTPDPRLNFTLILFFIFIGYFMVRGAVVDPDRGKRLVLRPEGPQADPRIVVTLLLAVAAYTLVFLGLWRLRYLAEIADRRRILPTRGQLAGVAP